MCCYLYALFSLKQGLDEDVTEDELAAITRWRGVILDVAIEEMAHLAIVTNILSSLGAPSHFLRPNFPIAPGYHPAGVVVRLSPFNPETLDHFIFLERPEGSDLTDGAGFDPGAYVRPTLSGRLMPSARDYATVGEFYAAIATLLTAAVQARGEDAVFIGDPAHQVGPEALSMTNLTRVRCLKTALAAIEAIVEQGEGSDAGRTDSHFCRFMAVRVEFRDLLDKRPDFRPARPAASNPVMRRPPIPDGRVWVDAEPAASVLDLGNALYNHSLRCLSLAWSGVDIATQRGLIDVAIGLMGLVSPVASRLTRLPVNGEQAECTAGISFATLRSGAALPTGPAAIPALIERLEEIGTRAAALALAEPALAGVGPEAGRMAVTLRTLIASGSPDPMPASGPVPASMTSTAPVPIAQADGSEVIEGTALDLHFSATRCIHARHCVLGQPQVFKANVEGPWIDPDAASTGDLVTGGGGVQYRRKDGGDQETAPPVNLVQLRENGPLGIRADMVLDGERMGFRATLCRCGASKNKPFCDGSHHEIAFQATGEPETRP